VDGCSKHQVVTDCVSSDVESLKNTKPLQRLLNDSSEQEFYNEQCTWKRDRCISSSLSTLKLDDINVAITKMAGGNAALQCAFKDNPAAALAVIYNCGTFCMKALLWEDYCERSFSLFYCTGLILRHVVDYRSYNLIPIAMASVSCLPAMYRWSLIGSLFLLCVLFCVLTWCLLITKKKVCYINCTCMCSKWCAEKENLFANPLLICKPIVYADQNNLKMASFTKIKDTIISIKLTHRFDKKK